jgi:hypothetical protein
VVLWLWAFGLTLLVEVPLGTAVLRWRGVRGSRAAGALVVCSAVTHPVLWVVLTTWPHLLGSYVATASAAEVAVTLVEGAILWGLLSVRPSLALGTAALVNGSSVVVGLLLSPILFA